LEWNFPFRFDKPRERGNGWFLGKQGEQRHVTGIFLLNLSNQLGTVSRQKQISLFPLMLLKKLEEKSPHDRPLVPVVQL
jgi:hypothetical protein